MIRSRLLSAALAVTFSASSLIACGTDPKEASPSETTVVASLSEKEKAELGPKLSEGRKDLLERLRKESSAEPVIVVDPKTEAVLSVTLNWNPGSKSSRENAKNFLATYQSLLDPKVGVKELQPSATESDCADSVVVYDRFVGGLQVAGSRVTLHFDGEGSLLAVTNGVASVPSTTVEVKEPRSLPEATDLKKHLGKVPLQSVKRVPVLVPMHDHSGLFKADVASWTDGSRFHGALAVGDVAVSKRLTPSSEGTGRSSSSAPRFQRRAGADLPDFISYRNLGGAAVNLLPAERNPLESAFRFLEEHATLYRTGSARCQFLPVQLHESTTAPGTHFIRLTQRHASLPVFGSELVLQLDGAGTVQSLQGRTLPRVDLGRSTALSAADAVSVAKAHLVEGATKDPAWQGAVDQSLSAAPTTRKVVFPRFLSRPGQKKGDRLAWEVTQGQFVFLIDGETKDVLYSFGKNSHRNVVRDAMGSNELNFPFYATDEVDGLPTGAISPRNLDNLPTRPGGNVGATLARVSSFYAGFGWLGQNGRGSDFVANTNVAPMNTPCPNAFYDRTFTNSAFYCLGVAADDVVGHEHTHGIIGFSSGLIYQDESGAINEAYADLFGNLISPDAAGTWFLGENVIPGGAARDMTDPTLFGQPGHMSAFVPRDGTCDVFPWSCDSGFVHTNSGIINRAHQLLADGVVRFGTRFTAGIGRNKLAKLAFTVMTERLPSDARMNDVAVATRDVCELFVARGVTDNSSPPVPYTMSDCDQVDSAFFEVGLGLGLGTGWLEPTLGFTGTDGYFTAGETTLGLCPVSNVMVQHSTLSGTLTGDLSPATGAGTSTNWLGMAGTTLVAAPGPTPFPIGTPLKLHTVNWFSVYGYRPVYATTVVPSTVCPPLVQASHFSPTFSRNDFFGAGGSTLVGDPSSGIDTNCTLVKAELELLGDDGSRLDGPRNTVRHPVRHWIFFVPVDFNVTASIGSLPPGGSNLQGRVNWAFDLGRSLNVRWRYTFNHPAGVVCTP